MLFYLLWILRKHLPPSAPKRKGPDPERSIRGNEKKLDLVTKVRTTFLYYNSNLIRDGLDQQHHQACVYYTKLCCRFISAAFTFG